MKATFEVVHSITSLTEIDLPPGKTMDDIKTAGHKHGTASILFNDDSRLNFEMNDVEIESIDWSCGDITVIPHDCEDMRDYDNLREF